MNNENEVRVDEQGAENGILEGTQAGNEQQWAQNEQPNSQNGWQSGQFAQPGANYPPNAPNLNNQYYNQNGGYGVPYGNTVSGSYGRPEYQAPPQQYAPYQQGAPYQYPPQNNAGYGYGYNQNGYNGGYVPYGQGFAPNGQAPYYANNQTNFAERSAERERQEAEKRKIKRLGNGIGLPLCIFFFGSIVISSLVSSFIMAFFGEVKGAQIMNDPNVIYLISSITSMCVLVAPYLITSAFTGLKWRELISFKTDKGSKILPVVMLGMGVCAISNYASSMVSVLLEQFFGTPAQTTMTEYGDGLFSMLFMLLCVGILPAVLEEFAFRGVILGSMRRYMSDGMAILLSSALFALLHGNLQQIPFAFGVGLVMAYATVYTGSLLPGMLIHAINNTMSVLLAFATDGMSPLMLTIISNVYMLTLLLIGGCGALILIKTDKTAFRLSKQNAEDGGKKFGWFISAPWIIVFVAICVLEVLIVQFGSQIA